MKTDRFIVTRDNLEKMLDKVEHLASCYEYSRKEILQIRLLIEELFAIVAPTLELGDAYYSVETSKDGFGYSINCAAGEAVMSQKTRDILLEIGKNKKKTGVFGMIGKVFDYLSSPEIEGAVFSDYRLLHCHYSYGAANVGLSYNWSPEFKEALSSSGKKAEEPEQERDLEVSLIEGYADDIQVYLKNGILKEKRLEIVVVKRFAPLQLTQIVFSE